MLSWALSGYLRLSRAILGYLGLSQAISGYLGLSWLSLAISGYLCLSLATSGYLLLSLVISDYLRISLITIKYQGASRSRIEQVIALWNFSVLFLRPTRVIEELALLKIPDNSVGSFHPPYAYPPPYFNQTPIFFSTFLSLPITTYTIFLILVSFSSLAFSHLLYLNKYAQRLKVFPVMNN